MAFVCSLKCNQDHVKGVGKNDFDFFIFAKFLTPLWKSNLIESIHGFVFEVSESYLKILKHVI